jgi:hypothetical protein
MLYGLQLGVLAGAFFNWMPLCLKAVRLHVALNAGCGEVLSARFGLLKNGECFVPVAVQTYGGHNMPVYAVRWNALHPRIFLSAGADWTVKLWDSLQPKVGSADWLKDVACFGDPVSTFLQAEVCRRQLVLWWDQQSCISWEEMHYYLIVMRSNAVKTMRSFGYDQLLTYALHCLGCSPS